MGAEEAVRALLDTEGWSLRDGAILAASHRAQVSIEHRRSGSCWIPSRALARGQYRAIPQ